MKRESEAEREETREVNFSLLGRNMCKKYDQTLVGHYNPDETVPFNTISDCIATSTVMSYSVRLFFAFAFLFFSSEISFPPLFLSGGLLSGALLASSPPLLI